MIIALALSHSNRPAILSGNRVPAFDCGPTETCHLFPVMTLSNYIIPLATLLIGFAIAPVEAAEPSSVKAGSFRFPVTEGWTLKETPRSISAGGMTYKTDEIEEGLDADFYHFGEGQGGSVEANIARWKGQFEGEPKEVETAKLAGGKIDFLHLEGTFLSGPPFGKKTPLKDHAMLAAILPSDAGAVFVKMTGPKDDIAQAITAFKAMVESAMKNS